MSDLAFAVDGPQGPSSGRIEAAGSHITVTSTDPIAAMQAAFGPGWVGRANPAAVAQFLTDKGLSVSVVGPHGTVLTAGAGVHSPIGALLGGSSHLRLGSARATAPLVMSQLTPSPRVRRRLLLGAGGAALLLAASRAVRRRAAE